MKCHLLHTTAARRVVGSPLGRKLGSSAMASMWLPVLPALTAPPRPVPRAQRVATRSVAFTAVSCALAWKAWSARQARRRLRAVLSTGNLPLDLVLDGGLPHGLVEVYGPPQGGKTSLALSCVEAAVKQGRRCAVLDVDRSWPGTSSCLARLCYKMIMMIYIHIL